MRALIVDDSRTMRTILGRIVAGLGFEVAQAGDGKQALAALAEGPLKPFTADIVLDKLRMLGLAGG
jgi:CheY-like chemotaxis protein